MESSGNQRSRLFHVVRENLGRALDKGTAGLLRMVLDRAVGVELASGGGAVTRDGVAIRW